ncbi:MAG: hypothetical protein DMF90_23380 [Acidobacteria bacterium]|nr:MAG: hypothetical protein DMF90_23380 [Acidobacteriota bacterium]
MDAKNEWLRHAVATVAYRAGKSVRGAPASFAGFRAGPTSRTAAQILSHMSDLFDWALSIADALTHVGQLTMMRRLAEAPVKGENYFKADIAVGRLGMAQQPAAREFD